MAKKYQDDTIEYIESDIEKIARKPLMYISYSGSKGALHLAKEVINNAIDEAISKKSPGKTVEIFFDEKENKITVSDDGRGIPFDKVELVCTKIQAGSKFDRDVDKSGVENKAFTAGENGVGITAVNALSDVMAFNIFRDGQKGTFVFNRGKLVKKEIVPATKKDKAHGTTVSFIPSDELLGKCKISFNEISEWVTNISYLIDPSVEMIFHYIRNNSDVIKTIEFKHENGIKDLLNSFVKKKLFESPYINFKGSYKAADNGDVIFEPEDPNNPNKSLGNDIVIQVALTMNPDITTDDDTHYKSFCNYVNTIDHGVHVNAVKTAWCQLATKLTMEAMSDNENKKYPISFDDARSGLFAVVNIMCDNPQFASQTKEKISNDGLFKPIRRIVYTYLLKYFKDNPSLLKKLTSFIKNNAKARLEIGKIRKSEYKPVDNLSENTLKCFNPANGDGYRELFIVEGGSAKGSLVTARDARTQALFALRGVPKNSFGIKLTELLTNQEFKYLIKVLGCGIGKDFNMSKLKYDKIIIFTDSDIDGFRITSLVCTFFITQYPEIVQEGLLYKAVAPLYIINDSKNPYILNKEKYYGYFADKIAKIISLYDEKGNKFKPSKFKELIIANNQYLSLLKSLINYYSISPDIIEFIIEYRTDKISERAFNTKLKAKFPEMKYHDNIVEGIYQGVYQFIEIDSTFELRSKFLKALMIKNGSNTFSFEDKNTRFDNVTLGQFLRYAKKYMPEITSRLKGLGEMDPDDLWESSLNPSTRELIQLTSANIQDELEKFQILHGRDSDARKELMKEYILDINDIDN